MNCRVYAFVTQLMGQLHTDSAGPDYNPDEESLSDYVKRMETDENLKKLAQKLESDLRKPDVSTQDLTFGKFEDKRRRSGDQ